ncbi:unnamed protein product [Phytomonas sp. EM1]|nr:unnamed protein product [Phytomonas sp. EM1]|eukprot:CCW60045.1 unnamed protein product [Phytomonas sp. isolate EM1]
MITDCTSQKDQCRIVLLGDEKVGKTSLISQLIDGVFVEHHIPTLLDSITYQDDVDGQTYTVEVIDTSSDSDFALHRSPYIEMADVIVFVYSVVIKDSLLNLKKHVDEVVKVRRSGLENFMMKSGYANEAQQNGTKRPSVSTSRYRKEVPIFLVGTHLDLVSSYLKHTDSDSSCVPERVDHELVELVSEHCLKSVGFPIGSLPNNDESNGRKKKNNTFQRMFKNIFKARKGVEKTKPINGVMKEASPLFSNQGNSSEFANLSLLPSDFSNSNLNTLLPSGASDRLPIFELSVKNSEQVSQLFLLILRFHILVKDAQLAGLSTPLLSPMLVRSLSSSSFSKRLDSPLSVPVSFSHAEGSSKKMSTIEEKPHFAAPFLNDVRNTQKVANSETPLPAVDDLDAYATVPVGLQQQDYTPKSSDSLHESVESQSTTIVPQSHVLPSSHNPIMLDDEETRKNTNENHPFDYTFKLSLLEKPESELVPPSQLQPHTPVPCGHPNNDDVSINNFPLVTYFSGGRDIQEDCKSSEVCFAHAGKPLKSHLGASDTTITGDDGASVPLALPLSSSTENVLVTSGNDGISTKHAADIIADTKGNMGKNINSTGLSKALLAHNKNLSSSRASIMGKIPNMQRVDRSKSELVPRAKPDFYRPKNTTIQKGGVGATRGRGPNAPETNLRRAVSSNDACLVVTPPASPYMNLHPKGGGGCVLSKINLESREHSFTPSSATLTDTGRQLLTCFGNPCETPNTRSPNLPKDRGYSMGEIMPPLNMPYIADDDHETLTSPCVRVKGSGSTETRPLEVACADEGEIPEFVNSNKNRSTSITMCGDGNFSSMEILVNQVTISTKEPKQPVERSLSNDISQGGTNDDVFRGYHPASTYVTRPSIKAKKVNAEPCSRNACLMM